MSNNRYVAQGEYYITSDVKTTLITSGMTECIAFALVDKNNRSNRLLCHLDGHILNPPDNALKNIQHLIELFSSFTQSNATHFDVYALGGNKNLRNYKNLSAALESLKIKFKKITDANDFCAEINTGKTFKYNPTNADMTMICSASAEPEFVSYSPKKFDPPLSENDLINGNGLQSAIEKEAYSRFIIANDNVLENGLEAEKTVRHCDDEKFISLYYKDENVQLRSKIKKS